MSHKYTTVIKTSLFPQFGLTDKTCLCLRSQQNWAFYDFQSIFSSNLSIKLFVRYTRTDRAENTQDKYTVTYLLHQNKDEGF